MMLCINFEHNGINLEDVETIVLLKRFNWIMSVPLNIEYNSTYKLSYINLPFSNALFILTIIFMSKRKYFKSICQY